MDWHIVTSSKGGVGKTLLSILLWVANLKKNKKVLLVELNGMNPDLYRLLAFTTKTHSNMKDIKPDNFRFGNYSFQSLEVELESDSYVIVWPTSPYDMLSKPEDFLGFLNTIYQRIIDNEFHNDFKPNTVIVDTNFHFGNIFSSNSKEYKLEIFQDQQQNFYIWFLWVFKQLYSLMNIDVKTKERFDDNANFNLGKDTLTGIATILEAKESNNKTFPCHLGSPIIHVFNTPTLIKPCVRWHPDIAERATKVLKKIFDKKKSGSVGEIKFEDFIKKFHYYFLKVIKNNEYKEKEIYLKSKNKDDKKLDIHAIFLKILEEYINDNEECHNNIIVIPEHEEDLLQYTDEINVADNIFKDITKREKLFGNFVKSLEASGILK